MNNAQDDFDVAMNYRLLASELFTALLDTVASRGCNCEYDKQVEDWYKEVETYSFSERVAYVQMNPPPAVEQVVIKKCKACFAMEHYQDVVGVEAMTIERSKFIRDPEVMPPEILNILEEELGRFDAEELRSAFMGQPTDESIIEALDNAQRRTTEFLSQYDTDSD